MKSLILFQIIYLIIGISTKYLCLIVSPIVGTLQRVSRWWFFFVAFWESRIKKCCVLQILQQTRNLSSPLIHSTWKQFLQLNGFITVAQKILIKTIWSSIIFMWCAHKLNIRDFFFQNFQLVQLFSIFSRSWLLELVWSHP
jgi:hypothetical protein